MATQLPSWHHHPSEGFAVVMLLALAATLLLAGQAVAVPVNVQMTADLAGDLGSGRLSASLGQFDLVGTSGVFSIAGTLSAIEATGFATPELNGVWRHSPFHHGNTTLVVDIESNRGAVTATLRDSGPPSVLPLAAAGCDFTPTAVNFIPPCEISLTASVATYLSNWTTGELATSSGAISVSAALAAEPHLVFAATILGLCATRRGRS